MPPRPPLFPYTTLFRSDAPPADEGTRKHNPKIDIYIGVLVAATAVVGALSSHAAIFGDPWLFVALIASVVALDAARIDVFERRSEEHTSELQSLRHLVCHRDRPSFPTRRSSDLTRHRPTRARASTTRRSTSTSGCSSPRRPSSAPFRATPRSSATPGCSSP